MHEPQQIINLGGTANDGTGDPLREAFAKVNNNFANVWASGPVNTQVDILDNRVTINETNVNLVLAGNGVGTVTLASSTVPLEDGALDIGTPSRRFDEVHALYYYGNAAFMTGIPPGPEYGNANVAAYLPNYTGNLDSLHGQVVTRSNVIANNVIANGVQVTGSISATGNVIAANINVPRFNGTTVSVTGNVTSANLNLLGNLSIAGNVNSALTVRGNISGTNVVTGGDVTAVNAEFVGNVIAANINGTTVSVTGNVTSANLNLLGNLSIAGNVNSALTVRGNISGTNVVTGGDVTAVNAEFVGNVAGNYFAGNGRFLTGIVSTGSNSIAFGTSNIAINQPNANITVSVNSVSNVAEFNSAGLTVPGNIVAGNIVGNVTGNFNVTGNTGDVLFNSNGVVGATDAFRFTAANATLSLVGNVVASAIIGNGQALTSVVTDRGTDSNNWNTLTQMGVYTVNRASWSGTVGTPLDSQVFVGLLEVLNGTDTAITQIFYPGTVQSGDEKIQWNRTYWAGTWSGWIKIVNDFQVVVGGEF